MAVELLLKNHLKKNKFFNKNLVSISKIFEGVAQEINNPKKTLNVLSKKFKLNFNINDLNNFKKFKTISIIGMGGSILGSEAIYGFLKHKIKKKIYFFNDLNEAKIINFKKQEKINKTLFIIISKSGNTIETLSNTFAFKLIKKNAKNIIIISERKNNLLFGLSKKFNLFYVEHKNYIGGRYSVLSEVGVLPAYLMGINISKLRAKLLTFLIGKNQKFLKESSNLLSIYLNSKKLNNLIFLNYAPELEKFLFWCQQLIAESLGKKNKGFLPVISNVPKDHHSLLQLYLDGPKDKIFYIFSINTKSKINIKFSNNIDKKHYLNKKTINSVKNAQKKALIKSLIKNNISFREFELNKVSEDNLGKIFSYFILETVIVGRASKLNPFDQPAVEKVKLYTKQFLS